MLRVKQNMLEARIFSKNNEENRKLNTNQRNCCVSLLRKTKKAYYESLDERKVSDNKLFWKTKKSSLSKKFSGRYRICLMKMMKL